MTIAELLNALERYDADMLVLVEGYEGGYDDIEINTESVARIPDLPAYCGAFLSTEEIAEEDMAQLKGAGIEFQSAVTLSRAVR